MGSCSHELVQGTMKSAVRELPRSFNYGVMLNCVWSRLHAVTLASRPGPVYPQIPSDYHSYTHFFTGLVGTVKSSEFGILLCADRKIHKKKSQC